MAGPVNNWALSDYSRGKRHTAQRPANGLCDRAPEPPPALHQLILLQERITDTRMRGGVRSLSIKSTASPREEANTILL